MAQKPSLPQKNKKFHKKYNLASQAELCTAITQEQFELESCSNPLKIREVL